MTILIFIVLVAIAYFAWRIVDLLPDIVFRLSEVQRDLAEIRRRGEPAAEAPGAEEEAPAADKSPDSD